MGKLEGKVAFITGAARGQGRSHAVLLAMEGADIIAVDICKQLKSVPYQMSTPEDLGQTVREVESTGRRIFAREVDVRDIEGMQKAFDDGTRELGPVNIVLANAGIGPGGEMPPESQWEEVIGVNLTGTWNTGRVAIPSMIEQGQGGAIVLTSSNWGLVAPGTSDPSTLAYVAAKHGMTGLVRAWANYLAPHSIRVNAVAPSMVRTPMSIGTVAEIVAHAPELEGILRNAMPVEAIESIDISNAVAWLVSDEARYVTGTVIPVDAGNTNRR